MNSTSLLVDLVVLIVIVGLVSAVVKSIRSSKNNAAGGGAGGSGGSGEHRRQPTANADRVVEDIKMTQTSRIVDAVAVLDDLDKVHPGYRQYAELIGTTQGSSSVTAPYSKRGVAYYDLRAFRVEYRGGRDVETLVAHEKSIEPFWFTDGSCDKRVYVDLESFGDDIILVNSANRIEGPNSDFAHAMGSAGAGNGTDGGAGARGPRPATAIVGGLRDKASGLVADVRERARGTFRAPQLTAGPAAAPAFALAGGAGAGGGVAGSAGTLAALPLQRTEGFLSAPAVRHDARENLALDFDDFGGGPGFGGPDFGGPGGFDGYGHLGDFLGPDFDAGHVGGPHGDYWGGSHGNGASEVLLGMGLGALVGQIANNMGDDDQQEPQAQFRGYRIVEDVVPLNQPVYALGELYKNGPAYTIGRSVSESYPSSFFATKPEAEVISHLKNQ